MLFDLAHYKHDFFLVIQVLLCLCSDSSILVDLFQQNFADLFEFCKL